MAITAYSQVRDRNVTTFTVTSDLSPPAGGAIYYHWYMDGAYLGMTLSNRRSFGLAVGEQVYIIVNDTTDPDYDPLANAPAGWPARRALWWIRSLDPDVDHYTVQQKLGAGDWVTISRVPHQAAAWSYSLLSGRLDDLSTYTWQIIPVDAAGNSGSAVTIGSEQIVRRPEAPDFTASFDPGTTKVTLAEAA